LRTSTNYPQIHWALLSELTIVLVPVFYHFERLVFPPFMTSLPSCPPSLHVLPPFVSFLPSCPPSLCVLPSSLPLCPSFLHVHQSDRACPSLLTQRFPLFLLGAVHSASPPPFHLISPCEVYYFLPSLSSSLLFNVVIVIL